MLEKTLENTLESREIKPVNLKEINTEYSLEGLKLKLKLWYFGHLMRRADSLEKTPMQRKIDDRRRKEWQRMRWLDSITDSTNMNLSKLWEIVKGREAWHAAVQGISKNRTWLSAWTTTTNKCIVVSHCFNCNCSREIWCRTSFQMLLYRFYISLTNLRGTSLLLKKFTHQEMLFLKCSLYLI